jgi:type VI secretion system protein ImpH
LAPQSRQPGSPIADRLFKEFYRFSFFKAVHLLEALYPEKRAVGMSLDPSKENIRFSVRPGLAFPPSDICGMKATVDGSPPQMEVAFLGLIGPSGVLPHWYNELALERNKDKDFSLTAFYDLFHHRLISLFYLAWKKHRFPENYLQGARDKMSWYLMSLMGLGTLGLSPKMGLPPEPLIFYGGLLSRGVPASSAIEAAVDRPVRGSMDPSGFRRPDAPRTIKWTDRIECRLWQSGVGGPEPVPGKAGSHEI